MDHIEYMAAADSLCTPIFVPQNVGFDEFIADVDLFIELTEKFDKYKKLMFRGRQRVEIGMEPFDGDSLAEYFEPEHMQLVHGIVGKITEIGELTDVMRNYLVAGDAFDTVNIGEEIGDDFWYTVQLLIFIGSDFEKEFLRNIMKLTNRHGAQFNFQRDQNRDLNNERAVLEATAPETVMTAQELATEHFGGNRVSSPELASLAARILGGGSYTPDDILKLAGSVVSQAEPEGTQRLPFDEE